MLVNIDMGKISIYIDWCGSNYAACPENDSIACVSTAETLEEMKKEILDALDFHREGLIADGDELPVELQGDIEPEWKLTEAALLQQSTEILREV